jgi:hypothetical protein
MNPMHFITQRHNLFGLLLALVISLWAGAASAQTYTQISSPELQSLMTAKGYTTEVDQDGDLIWTIDGVRSLLIVAKDQESIQFVYSSNARPSLETINQWNRSKRYSRSFIDKDGDPILKLDLDLAGGVTKARIYDYLLTARTSLVHWSREVLQR